MRGVPAFGFILLRPHLKAGGYSAASSMKSRHKPGAVSDGSDAPAGATVHGTGTARCAVLDPLLSGEEEAFEVLHALRRESARRFTGRPWHGLRHRFGRKGQRGGRAGRVTM